MKKRFLLLALAVMLMSALVSCAEEQTAPPANTEDTHTHEFGEWKMLKPVSCLVDGVKSRSCECGEIEVEHVGAPGHLPGEWVTKAPDCTNKGYRYRNCKKCDIQLNYETLQPLGHEYKTEVTDPTLTTEGYTTYTCKVCDYTYNDNFTDAWGLVEFTYDVNEEEGTCVITDVIRANVDELIVPEYIKGYKVVAIADEAFASNVMNRVAFIRLPSSITSIGKRAFMACANLEDVAFGNSIISIGDEAFLGCESLKISALPSSVESIGHGMFAGCSSLASFEFHDVIDFIPDRFFENCTSLKEVDFSSNVKSIGKNAFAFCSSITSVSKLAGVEKIDEYAFNGCVSLEKIELGKNIKVIERGAFNNVKALERVDIPTISLWYDLDFADASSNPLYINAKLYAAGKAITTITSVPAGVTRLNDFIFYGYKHITDVKLPVAVREIGRAAFENCTSLKKVEILGEARKIESEAFRGCSALASITLPDTVRTIGDLAFEGCLSLTGVTAPEDLNVIGKRAFEGCVALETVKFNHFLVQIGERAFAGCTVLDIVLPQSVKVIGDRAFSGCLAIDNLVLPVSLETVGLGAFENCENLFSVTIPKSVKKIGSGAFLGCDSLEVLNIFDVDAWCTISFGDIYANPLSLGAELYIDGEKVQQIVISGVLQSISKYAFWRCDNVEYVYYNGTAERLEEVVGDSNLFLSERIAVNYVYYYSETKPLDDGNYWHYNGAGNIVKW